MIATKDFCPLETEAKFREIFKELACQESRSRDKWSDVEIVYRGQQASGNFAEVVFMLANDERGNSYLYSAQASGNSLYSVTTSTPKTTGPKTGRKPRLRFR